MVTPRMSRAIIRLNELFTGLEDARREFCTLIIDKGLFALQGQLPGLTKWNAVYTRASVAELKG
jgi:hypothetical protein